MMIQYSEKDKRILEQAQKMQSFSYMQGISFCTREDKLYPKALRTISGMSPVLYYKGNVEIINQHKNIAVIGTRKPSDAGRKLAYETGRMVGKSNLNLVNGLALGCDTEAIKGALSADGRCVAIMPCGLEEIVPKTNQKLAEEILQKGGCLISEYPIGTKIQKYQYVERDKLQSGISQGILVVEAEIKSGTMHTAEFALKQYKRLACYYHKLLVLNSGNQYLEESGKAQILKEKKELESLIAAILSEDEYEQLTLESLIK